MIIIAHRGLNKNIKPYNSDSIESRNTKLESYDIQSNKKACSRGNTINDFKQSFAYGYGIETDIRDCCGKLVISHDMPSSNNISFENFLDIYKHNGKNLPLALNIKADGLCVALKGLLQQYKITNYFVFDMSIPDTLSYIKHGMCVFTRQSEYEVTPVLYTESQGVWLDEFYRHWINEEIILSHLNNHKKVCIVSPDLHGRDFLQVWEDYKRIIKKHGLQNRIMLCTDYTSEARIFFHE